ncbi:MAG: DUF2057 family protein [Gammaproteobacteria bacterium]|nr:DUF2057 family protein [Gammaproteobacteria bacterium]
MRLLLILSVLVLQACSTASNVRLYQGPALPNEMETTLVLPLNFELLSLDGQDIAQFEQTFRNHALNIKLTPGFHTLVLQYSDIWEIDNENHDKLTTGQLTFTGSFKEGECFLIQTPPLNTYAQAQAFTQSPSVNLVSDQQTLAGSHIAKADPLTFKKDETTQEISYPHLRQLKFWWQQASSYEKQQFEQWIKSAE